MYFELIGELADVETIAVGDAIREIKRIHKLYGKGRWRKLKGVGDVRLQSGSVVRAELHWYEAHGVGRKEIKI